MFGTSRALAHLALLAPLALSGIAKGQLTYTDTFEDGRNVGDWSWGNFHERIMDQQGVDGSKWRYNFNLFTCCPMVFTGWDSKSIFTGNYKELGVTSIGVDIAVLFAGVAPPGCGAGPSSPIGAKGNHAPGMNLNRFSQTFENQALPQRPQPAKGRYAAADSHQPVGGAGTSGPSIWLVLISDNGTPDNYDDYWQVYIEIQPNGTTPSGSGPYTFNWHHYDLEFDPAWLNATEMPEGWGYYGWGEDSPALADWQQIMSDVTMVSFELKDPEQWHLMLDYRVGVDNPRITINPAAGVGDCNGSGLPDLYDIAIGASIDCNRNGVPDECDLANGVDTDCTGTGVLDSCLAADAAYAADDRQIHEAIGSWFGSPAGSRLIWANRFDAGAGDTITNIAIGFHGGGGLQPGDAVEVFLWDDVNNDGSPADAVLLASAAGTVMTTNDLWQESRVSFDTYEIEPTFVSGTFFVGVAAAGDTFPAAVDITVPIEGTSWSGIVEPGADATDSFREAVSMLADCFGGVYTIRANGNDANNNEIPDVCETALGDLNGDGVVNVSDLLILLSQWGDCTQGSQCVADLNGDGAVNVSDLLLLLSNWG